MRATVGQMTRRGQLSALLVVVAGLGAAVWLGSPSKDASPDVTGTPEVLPRSSPHRATRPPRASPFATASAKGAPTATAIPRATPASMFHGVTVADWKAQYVGTGRYESPDGSGAVPDQWFSYFGTGGDTGPTFLGTRDGYSIGVSFLCPDASCRLTRGLYVTMPTDDRDGNPSSATVGVPLVRAVEWLALGVGRSVTSVATNDRYVLRDPFRVGHLGVRR